MSEFLIRRITLKQSFLFGFHVDSEGASSVEVCARVCVCALGIFSFSLLQQHRSEFRSKPWFWFVCHLWTDWNFWNCFLEMEGQLSALRIFGGSVTGFKAQKLRLMPSSLEADEVKGDGSYGCSYLIVWLVGEFDCSLVHAVLIRTFSGILFWSFWNSAQLEGFQAQCAGTFWTFTLCKLGALAATKFYVQDISLQY